MTTSLDFLTPLSIGWISRNVSVLVRPFLSHRDLIKMMLLCLDRVKYFIHFFLSDSLMQTVHSDVHSAKVNSHASEESSLKTNQSILKPSFIDFPSSRSSDSWSYNQTRKHFWDSQIKNDRVLVHRFDVNTSISSRNVYGFSNFVVSTELNHSSGTTFGTRAEHFIQYICCKRFVIYWWF